MPVFESFEMLLSCGPFLISVNIADGTEVTDEVMFSEST